MPKVKVLCRIVNGVTIKRFKPGYDDGTGKQPPAPIDGGITLNGPSGLFAGAGNSDAGRMPEPGVTIVDKDWVEAWLKENETTAFVTGGFIEIAADSEIPDEEPAAAQDPTDDGAALFAAGWTGSTE